MSTCPDCGGPLVLAFATTVTYVRCTFCGHVTVAIDPAQRTTENCPFANHDRCNHTEA